MGVKRQVINQRIVAKGKDTEILPASFCQSKVTTETTSKMGAPAENSKPLQMLTFDLMRDEADESSMARAWNLMAQAADDMTWWLDENMTWQMQAALLAGCALAITIGSLIWRYRESLPFSNKKDQQESKLN